MNGPEVKLPARIEAYKHAEPPLPPLTARHLYDWLMEIGPVQAGGMGPAPIGWDTIGWWKRDTFQRPSAWEVRTLHRLSREYLGELQAAEDPHRAAPWSAGRIEVDREANERQLRSVLG